MALTTEQQAQVDLQVAIQQAQASAQSTSQLALENARHANQMALMAAQQKLDATRLAQQTLVENARSKPADEREITPADIATFANALVAATNA